MLVLVCVIVAVVAFAMYLIGHSFGYKDATEDLQKIRDEVYKDCLVVNKDSFKNSLKECYERGYEQGVHDLEDHLKKQIEAHATGHKQTTAGPKIN